MDSLLPDPYKVLGVKRDADLSAIRSAHRKLVLKCHPDKFSDPVLRAAKQDEFQRVMQAYELLSDEKQRAKYDSKTKSLEEDKLAAEKADIEAEREDFIAFALKLFDEAKRGKVPDGPSTGGTKFESRLASSSPKSKRKPESIEEEIKERNRAFEDLKAGAPMRSTAAVDIPDTASAKLETRASSADKLAKTEKLYAVPVEQLNFKVMNSKQEDARVDIVAVHGLGAIPDITWKEKVSGINWLSHEEMLPRAVPEARILRFGYDSLWMGRTPIRTSLSTIAYKLLLSLNMIRMEDLERPLVFIGHCFGGLVIERALNLAKMRQSAYPGIFDSSVGVVFLGTPQRGTKSFTQDSALLAAIAASSDLSQNLEIGVLGTMTSESGDLLDMADDFVTLCNDGGPMISCFYEQRASKLGKVIGRNDIKEFIVDSTSATFDGHRKYGLELDHFSLNKFNGPDNPNYVQVRAEIVRFYGAALKKAIRSSTSAALDRSKAANEAMANFKISAEKLKASHAWNQLRRQRASPSPRPASPQTIAFSSRRGQVETREFRAEAPKSQAKGISNRAQPQSSIADEEEELRKEAIKELHEEEAKKEAALREEEYQKKLVEEKRAAEQNYIERLQKNMRKYGIENPEEILDANPLPKDEDLSEQAIKDKDKWYKNFLKGILSDHGLDGGKIDEILNNTGETIVIDGVETTFTKVARKWISTRTLDSYHIPWQKDKDDPSSILIKRWVPDYELAFLWDHSYALREGRGRKTRRDDDRAKDENKLREEPGKDWLLRMWESFKATPKKTSRKKPVYFDYESHEEPEEWMRENGGKRQQERWERNGGRDRERERDLQLERDKVRERHMKLTKDWYSEREKNSKQAYVEKDAYSPHTARPGATTPTTPSHEVRRETPISKVPSYERHRTASIGSISSAPDLEEVTRRRQHSPTLSGDRTLKRRASAQRARSHSSSRASERPRRQVSAEFVPPGRRNLTRNISPLSMGRPQLRDATPNVYGSAYDRIQYKKDDINYDINYAYTEIKSSPDYTPYRVSYPRSDTQLF